MPKCTNFFHLNCLFSKEYEYKFANMVGKPINDISNKTKNYRCPSHYCYKCYGTDDVVSSMRTVKCIKCPKSYHEKKCMPKTFIKIMKGVFLCYHHLKDEGIS